MTNSVIQTGHSSFSSAVAPSCTNCGKNDKSFALFALGEEQGELLVEAEWSKDSSHTDPLLHFQKKNMK
jgi:hypothetical protein